MGAEFAKNTGGLAKPPVRSVEAAGADTDNRAAGNPDTRTAATRPATRAAGSGAGAGAGKAEEEKSRSKLATVNEAVPAPEAPKKRQTRKPRKKKDSGTSFNAEQISALIVSVSAIVASREGFEMFALSKVEADQIATPLANMIAKSEKLGQLGEHADAVALVTACIVIFAPRIMLCFDAQKEKAKRKKEGVKIVREEKPSNDGDRKHARNDAAHTKNDAYSISAAIPSIM